MNSPTPENQEKADLPIWALADAFPSAPDGYGWIDQKGKPHPCASLAEVSEAIRNDDNSSILLVWTPDSSHCQLPEEIAELTEPIGEVRKTWVIADLASTKDRLKWVALVTAVYLCYSGYEHWLLLQKFKSTNNWNLSFFNELWLLLTMLSQSTGFGMAMLFLLIFGFIPWYQARKSQRDLTLGSKDTAAYKSVLRFETWLSIQKAPVTLSIAIVIGFVFLSQVIADRSIISFSESVNKAGLVKSAYLNGDYLRIFTAPFLHGGILHFVMNMLGLLYLGKRIELLARWPHLPIVFLFASLLAGEATARFVSSTSVGASGGLMGWLGFLLVFETLHDRLIPRSARRRLLGGLLLTALIGIIGYHFIDNAAHLGGLIAGMVYAAIVFPKSRSPLRPNIHITDRIVGSICLAIIFLLGLLAILRIFIENR